MATRPGSNTDESRLFSYPSYTDQQVLGGINLPTDLFTNPAMPAATPLDMSRVSMSLNTNRSGYDRPATPIPNPASPATYQTAPRGSLVYGFDQPQRLTNAVMTMPAQQAVQQYPLATANVLSSIFGNMQQPQQQGNQIVQTAWGPMTYDQWVQRSRAASLQPPAQQASAPQQQQQMFPPSPAGTSYAAGIDKFLADLSGNVKYLQNIVENKGSPIDVLPAWNAALEAMQRNIKYKGADLAEYFNRGGNYFSTSFGNAATDYYSQTAKDQNALLAQMLLASAEGAQGRELEAARQLAQYGFAGPSQLSSQAFQATQGDAMRALQAAMQGASGSDAAAQLMAQLGAQGAMGLLGGSITGAQGLFGAENQAAQQMYATMMGLTPSYLNYDVGTKGLGLQGANMLSNLWNQNLVTGSQLGAQQYNTLSGMISAMQNQWNQQQPWNNPLLPYMYQAATGYSPMYYPQYYPSQMPQLMGAAGSIMGSFPSFWRMITGGR